MEELEKINISNLIAQIKNMAISPKDALDSMGDDANFNNVASTNTFLFLFFVPLGMLISQVMIGTSWVNVRIHLPFSMWLLIVGAFMFYSLIIVFATSKIAWVLKDSMGFTGSQNKLNKIVVLATSAFFVGDGAYWVLCFIRDLKDLAPYLGPVFGIAAAGYVLFMGFDAEKFETTEANKIIFIGIILGALGGLTLIFNLAVMK